MNEFRRNWAQKMLDVLRSRKIHEDIGRECSSCHTHSSASLRCQDCFSGPLLCKNCAVKSHSMNPLHRIEHWNGMFFEPAPLCELGLVWHLGHRGQPCPFSFNNRTTTLTVLHTTGIHTVAVKYCECLSHNGTAIERPVQLCKVGLWPSSFSRPQTVFTIHVLKFFSHLTYQAKTPAHDFYGTLRRLTNFPFFDSVKVSAVQLTTTQSSL